MNETRTLARFVAETTLDRPAPPSRRQPQDRRARYVRRRARGHPPAVGAAHRGGGQDARRHPRGLGRPRGLAHGRRAGGLRQRRADRRVRGRAAHRVARERHRAAGRARGVRVPAARRRRVLDRAGPRLRGLGAHRAHGRGTRDRARLSQPRHPGAVRRGRRGGQALRIRRRADDRRAGHRRLVERGAPRVRVERRRHQAPAPRPRRPARTRERLAGAPRRPRPGDRPRGPIRLLQRVLDPAPAGQARGRPRERVGHRAAVAQVVRDPRHAASGRPGDPGSQARAPLDPRGDHPRRDPRRAADHGRAARARASRRTCWAVSTACPSPRRSR